MRGLKDFFKNFIKNQGQFVFVSLLVAKICAFLGSVFIINLLPENEFGLISIVAAVFAVFAPLNGFGSQQSLLRYGSIATSEEQKNQLSSFLFQSGMKYQFILSFLFFCFFIIFIEKYESIWMLFLFFAIRLFGFYFFLHLQSYYRVSGRNKDFAKLTNWVNILGLFLIVILTYWMGLKGYLISIAFIPYFSLFFLKDLKQKVKISLNFKKKEIFQYGLYAAATALLSDLLFSLDLLLLSWLTSESDVAHYKVAILIPSNLTFMALVFMQTDFPEIAKNYKNKFFLKDYITNYYKIFIPIVMIVFVIGFLFSKEILRLFFGNNYSGNDFIFTILLAVFLFNLLTRNLFGNLISAVGKMHSNAIVSFWSLLFLIILSIMLVPKYHEMGTTIAVSVAYIFSGIALSLVFFRYYRRLTD